MKISYVAWVRDKVGREEEQITLPAGVASVGELIEWLSRREARYADAFEFIETVKIFVNGSYADNDTPIGDDDVLMLVPPIAGG